VKLDWKQALSAFQRLSGRERVMLGVALGALLIIGLYSLIWEPLVAARVGVIRRIDLEQRQLVAVQRMRERYIELQGQWQAARAAVTRPDQKIELFPHIEEAVSQVNISRDHIVSMTPQSRVIAETYRQESVDLKLINLSLSQLVDLMYRIEKGPYPLRVTRLTIKKRPRDPHAFDVTTTVSMLRMVEG